MIGTRAPLPDLPSQVDPVAVRQAEVEQDELGIVRSSRPRAPPSPSPPPRRDSPAPTSAVRRNRLICVSSSTTRTSGAGRSWPWLLASGGPGSAIGSERGRRVSGAASRIRNTRAAAGAIRGRDRPAVRLDDAPGRSRGRARRPPRPRPRPAVELLEHLLLRRPAGGRARGRRPRSRSCLSALARRSRRGSRARVLDGVLDQVHEDLLEEHRIDEEQRQVLGQVDPDLAAPEPRLQPRPAPIRRSPRAAPTRAWGRCRRTPGAPCRGCWRSSRSIRSASVQIVSSSSARCVRAEPARVVAQRGAGAGDGGERGAQVVRDGARAASCASPRCAPGARPTLASSLSRARSSASAACRTNASRNSRCSTSRMSRRRQPQRRARRAWSRRSGAEGR